MFSPIFIALIFVMAVLAFRKFARFRRASYTPMNIPGEAQGAFLVCTFSMLGKLAEADGKITSDEIAKVESYIEQELKLDAKTKKLALKIFNDARSAPLELRDYAEQFQKTYPDRVALADKMIKILVELSAADGVLASSEDELIRSASLLLGLSEAGYKRIKEKVFSGVSSMIH